MTNRDKLDRIIVKNNDRMNMVISWFYENKNWLDREEFKAPMEKGVIELQGEKLEIAFESKNNVVEMAVYLTAKPNDTALIAFDYDPVSQNILNRKVAPDSSNMTDVRRKTLDLVILCDETDRKEALKYHALMQFMTYYHEEIAVEQRNITAAAKNKPHKKHKKKRPQPLIRRVYTINEFDSKNFTKPDGIKRNYTKPEQEVKVRGHLRHYKSGKTVWVKPCVKYKGQKQQPKKYEL